MHADTYPLTTILIGVAIAAMFLIGVFAHTPPQACALDADCSRTPVSGESP